MYKYTPGNDRKPMVPYYVEDSVGDPFVYVPIYDTTLTTTSNELNLLMDRITINKDTRQVSTITQYKITLTSSNRMISQHIKRGIYSY